MMLDRMSKQECYSKDVKASISGGIRVITTNSAQVPSYKKTKKVEK